VGHGPAVAVAVYSLGSWAPRRRALAGLAVVLGAVTVHQLLTWWVDGSSFAGNLVLLVGAWWMGDAARRRREDAAAHARRAEQLERAREELATRAVTEERLRIARELHDVVAHAMSAIAVQAGTGRVAFEREPDVARAALAEIEVLSRQGLAEMRRMLGVLRPAPHGGVEAHGGVDDPGLGRSPAASLADLDRLVATAAAAGVVVDLRFEGEPRALPAGVDLAAFRIVQEALTNVVRHAATDHARVTLCFGDGGLVVEVEDDGVAPSSSAPGEVCGPGATPPPPVAGGLGILGMRERAVACAGTLSAGPRPGGGFRVVAHLRGDVEAVGRP
jgi:signal transduction histidine kinase